MDAAWAMVTIGGGGDTQNLTKTAEFLEIFILERWRGGGKQKQPTKCACLIYAVYTSLNLSWGVLVLLKFWVNSQKLGSSGATECRVWIGNCNVKVWKSTEHKLHKIWRSVKFQPNEHTPGEAICIIQGCARFPEIWTVFQWTHKNLGVQAPQNVEFE